jgi:hypothetical protein
MRERSASVTRAPAPHVLPCRTCAPRDFRSSPVPCSRWRSPSGALSASAQDGIFSIWSGDERVGSLLVGSLPQGDHTLYEMTSVSNVSVVLWSYEIRTSVTGRLCG